MTGTTTVVDHDGSLIYVGGRTLDGGTVAAISDADLNSTGTATEVWITVRHGDVEAMIRATYSFFTNVYTTDEVTMA